MPVRLALPGPACGLRGESDPGDAKVLADLVRTDRHNHRPIAGDSDLAEAVKVLARAHQSMIWSRRRQANMLRSALREFYPSALAAFDDLTSGDAVEVLRAAPAPVLGAALSRPKIAAALRRGGRQRRIDARAAQIQVALRTPQLAPAPVIAAAMGATVSASVAVIAEMTTQIAALEQQLAADFESSTWTRRWSVPCQDQGPSSAPGCSASSATIQAATPPPSVAKTTPEHHRSPEPPAPGAPCWPATSATSASPTRIYLGGPSPPSATHPAPGPATTTTAPPSTPTTPRSAPSATASSASCTAAWPTTPPYSETTAWAHRTSTSLTQAA